MVLTQNWTRPVSSGVSTQFCLLAFSWSTNNTAKSKTNDEMFAELGVRVLKKSVYI